MGSTCTTLPSPLSVTERGESPSLGHHHPHHRLHGQHRSPRPVTLRRNGRFAKSLREVLWVEEVPVLYGISFDGRCHSRIITSSHPIADRRTITWPPHPPFSLSVPASLQQCTTTTHPFRCDQLLSSVVFAPTSSLPCHHRHLQTMGTALTTQTPCLARNHSFNSNRPACNSARRLANTLGHCQRSRTRLLYAAPALSLVL